MCWSPLQCAALIRPAAFAAASAEVKELENIKVQEQEGNLYGGISHWYFIVCFGDLEAAFLLEGLPDSCTQATSKQYSENKISFFLRPWGGRGEAVQSVNTAYTAECLRVCLLLPALLWCMMISVLRWESEQIKLRRPQSKHPHLYFDWLS